MTKHRYLFNAINYTEAESNCYKYMELMGISDFSIDKIVKTDVNDYLVQCCESEKYFSIKIVSVYVDEDGEEKKDDKYHYVVKADDIDNVISFINEYTRDQDIVVTELKRTALCDVITDIDEVQRCKEGQSSDNGSCDIE